MSRPLSSLLATYARTAIIPDEARERARFVLMDALIAILSGRVLPGGAASRAFIAGRMPGGAAGVREFATLTLVDPSSAAFVNGVLAHADETDDSHEGARMHPSCSIVPVAMAATAAVGATVERMLDAIAVGYDVGVAMNLATWPDPRVLRASRVSTHHTGAVFGSLAAALRSQDVDPSRGATAFSYAVQHVGGATTWLRDTEHIEKAVVFGGLPARSALFSLELASLGFSGVVDPFGGTESYFDAFGVDSDPAIAIERLASPGLAVHETCIKRYPVGMPIQAAAQAVDQIGGWGRAAAPDHVLVELPQEKVHVVNNREMANISAQYVIALRLIAGEISFDVLHELAPVPDGVEELQQRIELVGVRDLDEDRNGHGTTRVARVTMTTGDERVTDTVAWPVGTPRSPIGWPEIDRKAQEVLGGSGWTTEQATELSKLIRYADLSMPVGPLLEAVAAVVP